MTMIESRPTNSDRDVFAAHEGGKIGISTTAAFDDPVSLSRAYTPGVGRVSQAIAGEPGLAAQYTWRERLVAVVTDGSAVLGLGNVGPTASLPVMEGKAAILKEFAGINAIPVALNTTGIDQIVETLLRLRPSFGAVSLEDVAAPGCFELERRLMQELDCPVMHDDQHGTAIAVLAGLRGACQVVGRPLEKERIVIAGAGASGIACARILLAAGVSDIVLVDSVGVAYPGRHRMTAEKLDVSRMTNPRRVRGGLAEALEGASIFIGLSSAKVPEEMLETMASDPIVFCLSNPIPEITPKIAEKYAAVVGTGGGDHPNQIINTLASPGIYRGVLDAGSSQITESMKLAAADAIAGVVADELSTKKIIPHCLDSRVPAAVAAAVVRAAEEKAAA